MTKRALLLLMLKALREWDCSWCTTCWCHVTRRTELAKSLCGTKSSTVRRPSFTPIKPTSTEGRTQLLLQPTSGWQPVYNDAFEKKECTSSRVYSSRRPSAWEIDPNSLVSINTGTRNQPWFKRQTHRAIDQQFTEAPAQHSTRQDSQRLQPFALCFFFPSSYR